MLYVHKVPAHEGNTLPVLLQGSYRCGPCKTGYVGDQKQGCKPERACGNGQANPCHASADCIVHREGTIECQVTTHLRFHVIKVKVGKCLNQPALVPCHSAASGGLEMATSVVPTWTSMAFLMRNWTVPRGTVTRRVDVTSSRAAGGCFFPARGLSSLTFPFFPG